METAKVDIRKLQLLNDCINRTIEALNQVRLSVHGAGLSHSAPIGVQGVGFPGYGATFAAPFGATPFGIAPQLVNPQTVGMVPTIAAGLGHTAATPFYPAMAQQAAQQAAAALANPWTSNPWTNNSLAYLTQQGLAHSAAETAAYTYDPYVTARIAQTFPFVHWGYSPFAWPNV